MFVVSYSIGLIPNIFKNFENLCRMFSQMMRPVPLVTMTTTCYLQLELKPELVMKIKIKMKMKMEPEQSLRRRKKNLVLLLLYSPKLGELDKTPSRKEYLQSTC